WIEDGAYNENTSLATPVHLSDDYGLSIAVDATQGMQHLRERVFDAIVVDIRIPPGDDPRWIEIYYDLFRRREAARLGLKLLQIVLGRPEPLFHEPLPSAAKDAHRYGVLSVEGRTDLLTQLTPLGVSVCYDKGRGDDPDVLLKVIDDILRG